MIKKDSDRLWNSIPVDLRNKIKNDFAVISKGTGVYDMAQTLIMCEYFGKHNLQSVFDVGDKVTIKGQIVVRNIAQISKDGRYALVGKGNLYEANELELFTGFTIGDKVMSKFGYAGIIGRIVEHKAGDDKTKYRVSWWDGDSSWEEECDERNIIKIK